MAAVCVVLAARLRRAGPVLRVCRVKVDGVREVSRGQQRSAVSARSAGVSKGQRDQRAGGSRDHQRGWAVVTRNTLLTRPVRRRRPETGHTGHSSSWSGDQDGYRVAGEVSTDLPSYCVQYGQQRSAGSGRGRRQGDGARVRKVTCFSIFLNFKLLFCNIFDCKERTILVCEACLRSPSICTGAGADKHDILPTRTLRA